MPNTLHALDFLADPAAKPVPGVVTIFGDEPFLKRLALAELRHAVLNAEDGEFSLTTLDGEDCQPRDAFDELATVSMFGGGRRMVVIEDADTFVTRYRGQLENYVAKPKPGGVLVLIVKTWPSNTRLFKAVDATGLGIDASAPQPARLLKWMSTWAKQKHKAKLDRTTAEALVEIIGPELGLLDQELAKLAAAAGPGGEITAEMVDTLVGGWRAKTTWDMLDAALEGHAPEALRQLERLIWSGESPIGLLAQVGSSLRRFAAATRLIAQAEASGRKVILRQALEGAGVQSRAFILEKAERQLKQVGRQRGASLYRWLLEADLALKGSSSSPARARIVLEQLVCRLSTLADPRKRAAV